MKIINSKIQARFIIISIVISLIQILFSYMFVTQKNISFIFVIPVVLLCINYVVENYIKKESNVIQFVSVLFSICTILFIQLGICITILLNNFVSNNIEINKDIKNLNEYTVTIKNIHSVMTRQFPTKIPKNAKNTIFYCSGANYFGGRIVYLKFEINSDYIQSEINKYNYIVTEGPYDNIKQYSKSYARSFIFDDVSKYGFTNGYKLYVIGNNSNTKNCHDYCEYGIAVNNKTNTIIYYASNPD